MLTLGSVFSTDTCTREKVISFLALVPWPSLYISLSFSLFLSINLLFEVPDAGNDEEERGEIA